MKIFRWIPIGLVIIGSFMALSPLFAGGDGAIVLIGIAVVMVGLILLFVKALIDPAISPPLRYAVISLTLSAIAKFAALFGYLFGFDIPALAIEYSPTVSFAIDVWFWGSIVVVAYIRISELIRRRFVK